MQYDVFISYSRKDYVDEQKNVIPGNEVSKIKEALTQAGITYWFDEEGIYSGQNFVEKIVTNIENAKIFLFLSTANANKSPWTCKEIASADEFKKHIIPVRLDPSPYNKKVLFRIADLDYIEYFSNPLKGMEDMIKSIKAYLDELAAEEKRKAEEESKKKEEARKKAEELKRQQEELFRNIRMENEVLNVNENKLMAERKTLLLKTETVSDAEKKAVLRKEIQESGPMARKFQEERKSLLDEKQRLINEISTLKDAIQKCGEENKAARKELQKKLKEKEEWIAQLEQELAKARQTKKPVIVSELVKKKGFLTCAFSILAIILLALIWIVKDEKELEPYRKAERIAEAERLEAERLEMEKQEAIKRGEFTVNGVFFRMIPVEGGTYDMGSDSGDSDEMPIHQVTVGDFYIGETEVTQALWKAVMGNNPSYFKGAQRPVECVSWEDICGKNANDTTCFIYKLNRLTEAKFRLPTEAEWEYAARGGKFRHKYVFSGGDGIDSVAWYDGNSSNETHPVKYKKANGLGLYDMSGNVWEWCQDWYGSYSSDSPPDPTGPASGSDRVLRGGGWGIYASDCRVADRYYYSPVNRYFSIGFRLSLIHQ